MTPPLRYRNWHFNGLLALVLLSGLFLPSLFLGVTDDEGYFAELARRCFLGEWPHLDFAANYPGLWYAYTALWYDVLGPHLWVFKLSFFALVASLGIPSIVTLAKQAQLSPKASIGFAIAACAMGYGLYWQAHGNWVTLSLLFWAMAHCRSKPLGSGIATGLALLVKPSLGLLGVLALWCWPLGSAFNNRIIRLLPVFAWLVLTLVGLCLREISRPWVLLEVFILYGLPAIVLMRYLWTKPNAEATASSPITVKRFGLGLLLPVVAFACAYAAHGGGQALAQLWAGVMGFSKGYLHVVTYRPYVLGALKDSVILAAISTGVGLFIWRWRYRRQAVAVLAIASVAAFLWWGLPDAVVFQSTTFAHQALLGTLIFLQLGLMAHLGRQKQRVLTAQTALAAWGVILFANTYPLNLWGYYAYSAPLLVLGFAATAPAMLKRALTALFILLTLLALLFAWRLTDRSEQPFGHYFPLYPDAVLADGVWLTPEQAQVLPLVAEMQKVVWQQPYARLFVTSDLPLAWFLSGQRNPTPYTYAFDARAMGIDEAQLNTLLAERGVTHLVGDIHKGNGWNMRLLHVAPFGVP